MWSPGSTLLALLLLPGPAIAEAAGQVDDSAPEKPKTQTVLSNSEPAPAPTDEEPLLGLPLQQPAAAAAPGAVVHLQGANFVEVINGPGNTFVKFYAPWCGHCMEMAPEWEELAEHFQLTPIPGVALTVAEVDCTGATDGSIGLCMEEAVHGYPTIRLYREGEIVYEYVFARTFERMKQFLQDKLFDISSVEPNSIGVYELNDLSFQKLIDRSGSSPTLVFFYVQWCGHCKDLKSVWEELAIQFLMEEAEDVKFAQVDCMDALEVCTEESIEGFPQVMMYKDGMMEDVFSGERNLEELSNFVWETVDPSRVEHDDGLDAMMMMSQLGGMGAGQDMEDKEEEMEEEMEECDCSDPDCDCEEYDEDNDEEEDDEEQEEEEGDEESDEEEEDEDEEATDEEIEYLTKKIEEDQARRKAAKAEGQQTKENDKQEKENDSHDEL